MVALKNAAFRTFPAASSIVQVPSNGSAPRKGVKKKVATISPIWSHVSAVLTLIPSKLSYASLTFSKFGDTTSIFPEMIFGRLGPPLLPFLLKRLPFLAPRTEGISRRRMSGIFIIMVAGEVSDLQCECIQAMHKNLKLWFTKVIREPKCPSGINDQIGIFHD